MHQAGGRGAGGGGGAVGLEWWFLSLLVLVLWLQEGIFKTCQSRLGERLLQLEGLMHQDVPPPGSAFLLHTDWLSTCMLWKGSLPQK